MSSVQLVTAVVRPVKAQEICDALLRFGFTGVTVTVTEAAGPADAQAAPEIYRGAKYFCQFQPHAKIEVVASDLDVGDLIEVIRKVASTGRNGDGKVWVTPVTQVVRLSTGDVGIDAV